MCVIAVHFSPSHVVNMLTIFTGTWYLYCCSFISSFVFSSLHQTELVRSRVVVIYTFLYSFTFILSMRPGFKPFCMISNHRSIAFATEETINNTFYLQICHSFYDFEYYLWCKSAIDQCDKTHKKDVVIALHGKIMSNITSQSREEKRSKVK